MSPFKPLFLLVICMSVSKTVSIKRFHSIAGPFRIDLKRIEKCCQEATGPNAVKYFIEIRKRHHEPTLYSGNSTIPFILDDTAVGFGNLSSWSNNGGWKPNAYQATIKKPCTLSLRYFKPHYEFLNGCIFGEIIYCPFPAGIYRFNNITLPEHLLRSAPSYLKQFIYGRWRAEARGYTKNGELVASITGYVDTLPVPI